MLIAIYSNNFNELHQEDWQEGMALCHEQPVTAATGQTDNPWNHRACFAG
jgi:hypothetical protein